MIKTQTRPSNLIPDPPKTASGTGSLWSVPSLRSARLVDFDLNVVPRQFAQAAILSVALQFCECFVRAAPPQSLKAVLEEPKVGDRFVLHK